MRNTKNDMNEPISLDKKYKYRNGEPARILCVDGNKPDFPVVSQTVDGVLRGHRPQGACQLEGFDLVEVHEPRTLWVNEYRTGFGFSCDCLEDALNSRGAGYIGEPVQFREVLPE